MGSQAGDAGCALVWPVCRLWPGLWDAALIVAWHECWVWEAVMPLNLEQYGCETPLRLCPLSASTVGLCAARLALNNRSGMRTL